MSSPLKTFGSRFVRIALAVLAGIVIGNPILLYFIQDRLIFYPHAANKNNREHIKQHYAAVEEISLVSSDGVQLHGWLQRARGVEKAPLLIYFGGNDEDISFVPSVRDRVDGWSLATFDYRGYGVSEGTPSEEGIFRDSLAIYDALVRRPDIDRQRIAVMGRSLGSGVATYLAANRPATAVILVTPYDSILSVAQDRLWFAPVSLLLKHPFDSLSRAPAIHRPALFLIAANDETIPRSHSRRLFDAWSGSKRWHIVKDEDHDTILFHPSYWKTVSDFLREVND